MNSIKVVIISDIHFGKKDPKTTYDMLKQVFMKYCIESKPDLIVIAGDLFDKRFGLHSDVSEYTNRFISDVVTFCNENGSDMFLIHGTMSHDNLQLKTFKHYLDNPHVKIFDTVTETEYRGYKILIMPEEYVKFDYYKPYLRKKPDLVFGHGMFDFATVVVRSDRKMRSEALNSKFVSDNVKYGAYFGHVHTHQKHGKVTYTGSFDRLAFGEEEDKGFVELTINDKEFKENFIINGSAQLFKSINANDIPDDLEKLLKFLDSLTTSIDYLRIVIDSEISESKFNNIVGFVKNHPSVSILKKIIGVKREEEIAEENEKVRELENKLKQFENMGFIEITKKIGKENYGIDFTTDEILELMEKEVKK